MSACRRKRSRVTCCTYIVAAFVVTVLVCHFLIGFSTYKSGITRLIPHPPILNGINVLHVNDANPSNKNRMPNLPDSVRLNLMDVSSVKEARPQIVTTATMKEIGELHEKDASAVKKYSVPKRWTLVDIPKHFNNSLHESESRGPEIHRIVWFNMPDWIKSHAFMSECDYKNCEVTTDRTVINKASAIMFCIIHPGMGHSPPVSRRDPNQVWVAYGLEPPFNYYFSDYKSSAWRNTINWTMTYRTDADVQEPYGMLETREALLDKDYNTIFREKKKFAVWIVSHCHTQSKREDYVNEMKKYVSVDIYGGCGTRFTENITSLVSRYKFFLSFENCFCPDYVTEKLFKYYNHDVILVTRGGADYDKLLPNDTLINTGKFANVKELTDYLAEVGSNQKRYVDYLRRKDVYKAYTESFTYNNAMCDLCWKLNHKNSYRNIYPDVHEYIQKTKQCTRPSEVIIQWIN